MNRMDQRELQELVEQMHDALQTFCERQEAGSCPMWTSDMRYCGKQCRLRDIEDKMRELGFEVEDD